MKIKLIVYFLMYLDSRSLMRLAVLSVRRVDNKRKYNRKLGKTILHLFNEELYRMPLVSDRIQKLDEFLIKSNLNSIRILITASLQSSSLNKCSIVFPNFRLYFQYLPANQGLVSVKNIIVYNISSKTYHVFHLFLQKEYFITKLKYLVHRKTIK